eukprot:COSAG01_NODE_28660_length_656_cov_0.660682_2_plen_114_part_01
MPFSTKTHVSHSLDTASEWNISAEAPLGDDPKMLPPSSSSSHGIPPREAKGWQRHARACEPIITRDTQHNVHSTLLCCVLCAVLVALRLAGALAAGRAGRGGATAQLCVLCSCA